MFSTSNKLKLSALTNEFLLAKYSDRKTKKKKTKPTNGI